MPRIGADLGVIEVPSRTFDATDPQPAPKDLLSRITQDPQIMGGRPCIRGMRVTVGTIVGLLAAGHTMETILETYPYLNLSPARVEFLGQQGIASVHGSKVGDLRATDHRVMAMGARKRPPGLHP
jgi:uncharacterized protein (DUF433 family)